MPFLEDERFAAIAKEKTLIQEDQVKTAIMAQEQAAAQGVSKPLATVLQEQGVLSQQQVTQVNEAVQAAGSLKLGDFEVLNKLGEGGMGAVYHARQISLDREVALKLLPMHLARNAQLVSRFKREAQVGARLDHPNIVRGLALGEIGGQHYFAMEFVKGKGLDSIIEEEGTLPIDRCVDIIRQACLGLEFAHNQGMVHRGIKPANLMITDDGVVKIADMGLVKQSDTDVTRLTQSSAGMGTPAYMPPEQARSAKHVDARSDIYSLGATLYHMLTGDTPFQGESAYEIIQAAEQGRYKPPSAVRRDVPSDLSLICEKMIARKPDNRFQSAREVIEALDKLGGGAADMIAEVESKKTVMLEADVWFIRVPKADGSHKLFRADTLMLKDLIRKGKVSKKALLRRGESGAFRPIDSYPELKTRPARVAHSGADLSLRATVPVQPAPARAGKPRRAPYGQDPALSQFYGELQEKARKRARMKRITSIAKKVVPVVAILVLLFVGWKYREEIKLFFQQVLE